MKTAMVLENEHRQHCDDGEPGDNKKSLLHE
jgi:hypothetical protein